MGKKRKSLATSLDEVDRTMYSTFCTGANAISQLYSQAMNHQKLSFQAGERHGLEKLYQWILRQQEGGSRVTTADILTYLQSRTLGVLRSCRSSPENFAGSLARTLAADCATLTTCPHRHRRTIITVTTDQKRETTQKEKTKQKGEGEDEEVGEETEKRRHTCDHRCCVAKLSLPLTLAISDHRSLGSSPHPKPTAVAAIEKKRCCVWADLDCYGEEPSMSPRAPLNQHLQTAMPFTNSSVLASAGLSGVPTGGQGFRSEHSDQQSKNYVFSNALSSPVRRSLQNYHISQGDFNPNGVQQPPNEIRNNEPNSAQLQNSNSNDSSMDMHADSPGHESTY